MRPHPRRRSTAPVAVLLALAAGCSSGEDAQPEVLETTFTPPIDANLVIVSLDTTRADRLGCYGYDKKTTPRIDQLAAAGHLFENAFTTMTTTLPSHAAMFTSLYPRQLGVLSNLHNLSPEANTLAERLHAAGFATAAMISSQPLAPKTGIDQGFEKYFATKQKVWDADRMYHLAKGWIREHADRRFFLFVHMFDPHAQYGAPEEFRKQFKVEAEGDLPGFDLMAFMKDPALLTPEIAEDSKRAYDAELRFADKWIGKLIDDMRRAEVFDQTIFVFLSDHGETLDELIEPYGYAFDHGEFLYPREIRVPFVIFTPPELGLPAAMRHEEQISTLDLMPTLLELLGVPCEAPYEGRSLVPLFRGEPIEPMTFAVERHEVTNAYVKWIEGEDYALVQFPWLHVDSDSRGKQLFHLGDDPDAERDLAAEKPDELERLAERLRRWRDAKKPRFGIDKAAPGSERDKALKGHGYVDGG